MNIGVVLSVTAGLMHLLAFAMYHKQMLKGFCSPQLGTWGLWVFISTMNCISYIAMSEDIIKGLLPIASTIACIWVFIMAAANKKFPKFDFWDKITFWIGVIALGFWWYYQSAAYGNLILQVSIFISFIPTYRGIIENPETEKKLLPWFIWAFAYLFTLAVVFLRWKNQYQDIVYPINCFLLHFGVGIIALIKNPQKEILK